jgi:hypothetical protein
MNLNRIDADLGAAGPEPPPADLDPRMVLALRSALASLVDEQKRKVGGVPPAAPNEETKKETEPPLFWKLCSAALLSVAALIGVTLYNQLSAGSSQTRADLGQIRNEVALLRNDLVSKDDYNTRTKGVIDAIKQAQATNNASIDTWRELLHEQKLASSELRLQIKELERDLQRLRERLSVLEQREATPKPESSPRKKGN